MDLEPFNRLDQHYALIITPLFITPAPIRWLTLSVVTILAYVRTVHRLIGCNRPIQVFFNDPCFMNFERNLNINFRIINEWFYSNLLSLNFDKTYYLFAIHN
jgi:hypothetical protein